MHIEPRAMLLDTDDRHLEMEDPGASQTTAKHRERNGVLLRIRDGLLRGAGLVAALCLAIVACTPATARSTPTVEATKQATSGPPVTFSPTSTPSTTSTPTLEPTATRTPRPTTTPFPDAAFSGEPADIAYLVPLTVQKLNSFEATVHFELQEPGSGWLLYQPTQASGQGWWVIPLEEDRSSHQIPLIGLTPGTSYRVQVGLGDSPDSLATPLLFGSNWGPVQFETPNLGEPNLRFGVIGDSGFGDNRTRDLIDVMRGYDLDFVLHTGDVVYNVHEEPDPPQAYAKKYYRMFAPLLQAMPVFPVLGNHEFDQAARFEGEPFFLRAFPVLADPSVPETAVGTWYVMEYSGIQFLMLDSAAFHGSGGRAEQTAWLNERLSEPGYRFSIAVYHTPPYTSGRHRNDGVAIRGDWIPLFEAAGVPITFSGHDHNYERIIRNDVTYVVSGGGSAVLYPETEQVEGSQKFHRRTHFVLVEIFDEHLTLSAIDTNDTVIDRTRITLGLN